MDKRSIVIKPDVSACCHSDDAKSKTLILATELLSKIGPLGASNKKDYIEQNFAGTCFAT